MNKDPEIKAYPETIVINESKLVKSVTKVYTRFKPDIDYPQIEEFLNDKKILTTNVSPSLSGNVTKNQERDKKAANEVILEFPGSLVDIDENIHNIESDSRVDVVAPVYTIENSNSPSCLTFNEYIIILTKEEVSSETLKNILQPVGVKEVSRINKKKIILSTLDKKNQNTYEVAEKLKQYQTLIEFADLNWIQVGDILCSAPNDPYFNQQWSLLNTGQQLPDNRQAKLGCDVKASPAWAISKGSPLIVIAILDTGCDLKHEDLASQLVQKNRWFDAVYGALPEDTIGHGTSCAGIAAAATNSIIPKGIAGFASNCRIMPIRISTNENVSQTVLQSAIDQAAKNSANVLSLSLALNVPLIPTLKNSIDNCITQGIVIVAAAGNRAFEDTAHRGNALNTDLRSPANYDPIIAVGATNENDFRCTIEDWTFFPGSEYGKQLSVVAPGVHMCAPKNGGGYRNDFYGTSAATPLVAGLVGLMLSYNPTLNPATIKNIIQNQADRVGIHNYVPTGPEYTRIEDNYAVDPSKPNWNPFMGYGRINAETTLNEVKKNYQYGPADVYIRDSLTDDGSEPYTGNPLCFSPDIIVRQYEVNQPHIEFSDKTVDPGSDPIAFDKPNYIYIRVHNRGKIKTNIHARLYYAPLSTTCTPDHWQFIDQYDFYNVDENSMAVSEEILWEEIPTPRAVDHYCLIASIEGVQDPHPDPAGIADAQQYMDLIRNHNNISYRNLVFEQVLPNTLLPIPFYIYGFNRNEVKSELRIIKHSGAESVAIELRLPDALTKSDTLQLRNMIESKSHKKGNYRTFVVDQKNNASINELTLHRGSVLSRITVNIPEHSKPETYYKFSVQQLIGEKVLGDFQIIAKVLNPATVKYVGERDKKTVHKIDCKSLKSTDRKLCQPFSSLVDAKARGYNAAEDCIQ